MAYYLGIDTSNYSTSLSLYNSDLNTENSIKKLLPVKNGELGLRQSDAVFLHTKGLPEIFEGFYKNEPIKAIGVSTRPRSKDGSYMPCFLVGESVASIISRVLNVPLYTFSHQDGHIVSALYSANKLDLLKTTFIAFHLSGGTTEALLVSPNKKRIIDCKIISETLDLNAGQAIDRVGKMLGLPFPAGPFLEELAENNIQKITPTAKLYNGNISLSGLENKCRKLLDSGKDRAYIADFAVKHIERVVDILSADLKSKFGDLPLIYSGGVMSNHYIREQIEKKHNGFFATPQFSSDNALGIAILSAIKNEGNL